MIIVNFIVKVIVKIVVFIIFLDYYILVCNDKLICINYKYKIYNFCSIRVGFRIVWKLVVVCYFYYGENECNFLFVFIWLRIIIIVLVIVGLNVLIFVI